MRLCYTVVLAYVAALLCLALSAFGQVSISGGSSGVSSGALTGAVVKANGSNATTLRDFASIIDYGADPTGVADSAAAITSAMATGKCAFDARSNGAPVR